MGRLIRPGWYKDWMDGWMDEWTDGSMYGMACFLLLDDLFHDVVSRWIPGHATYLHTRHKRQFFLFTLRFPFLER